MEVSTMLYICIYCVFTWDGRLTSSITYCVADHNIEGKVPYAASAEHNVVRSHGSGVLLPGSIIDFALT